MLDALLEATALPNLHPPYEFSEAAPQWRQKRSSAASGFPHAVQKRAPSRGLARAAFFGLAAERLLAICQTKTPTIASAPKAIRRSGQSRPVPRAEPGDAAAGAARAVGAPLTSSRAGAVRRASVIA